MELLKEDLFKDPNIEENRNRTAGAPCATALAGGTKCFTGTFTNPDSFYDTGF